MMMQVTKSSAINLKIRNLSPGWSDTIVSFILGNRDVWVDNVANSVKFLVSGSSQLILLLFSLFNLCLYFIWFGFFFLFNYISKIFKLLLRICQLPWIPWFFDRFTWIIRFVAFSIDQQRKSLIITSLYSYILHFLHSLSIWMISSTIAGSLNLAICDFLTTSGSAPRYDLLTPFPE